MRLNNFVAVLSLGLFALNSGGCAQSGRMADKTRPIAMTDLAPIRNQEGVLYPGHGSSSIGQKDAFNEAYQDGMKSISLETGIEISHFARYLTESSNNHESFDAAIDGRYLSHNFLTKSDVRYARALPSESGYKAEIGIFLSHETLNQMRLWSSAIRERRLSVIRKHFRYGEGIAEIKPGQPYAAARRISTIKAYQDLYEQTHINYGGQTLIENGSTIKDSIYVETRGTLQGVETVSIKKVNLNGVTNVITRVRMPTRLESAGINQQ